MNISFKKQNILNYVALASIVFFAVWYFFLSCSSYINSDEKEHLYASFLIAQGDVPYRDFFEHHHPLLWYLFSPVVMFLSNSENILYAMRFFSYVVFYKLYKKLEKTL